MKNEYRSWKTDVLVERKESGMECEDGRRRLRGRVGREVTLSSCLKEFNRLEKLSLLLSKDLSLK